MAVLPTTLTPGDTDHILHHETIHALLNDVLDEADLATLTGFGVGTWTAMQAVASPSFGDRWIATDQGDVVYTYVGAAGWRLPSWSAGFLNLLEYGAKIDTVSDDRAAWVLALAEMASTAKACLVPFGVTGVSRISTGIGSIGASGPAKFAFFGVGGGGNGPFGQGGQVEVTFDTGGFEFIYGVSGSLALNNLYIIGVNAPGVWMNNAAGLTLHSTTLRGYGTNAPGLKSTDNFFVYADPDCSFQSSDTSTPSILIEETSGVGGGEAWDYFFQGVRLNIGNIKLTVGAAGPSVVGEQLVFQDIVGENFAASTPVLDVVWTAAYALHEITMKRCNVADSSTPFGVRFTNNSGGSNTVYNFVIEQTMAGITNIVQCAGASVVAFTSALVLGLGQRILPSGGTTVPIYLTLDNTDGAWRSFSNIAAGTILMGKKATDAQDRCTYAFDGIALGDGTVAPDMSLKRRLARKWRLELGATGSGEGDLEVNGAAGADVGVVLMIAGSQKGEFYCDQATGEIRLYKAASEVRIDSNKIGFLNKAPAAIQSVGAAASDPASTQTLANNLRTALINFGLCQT